LLTRTIGQGRKSGNEPLRKRGLGLYGCPHLNPPLSSAGPSLTAEMDHRVPQMVETSYPGVPSLHSLRGFILTVLESSKDAVEQVDTPHHTHHLHTTTTHHFDTSVPLFPPLNPPFTPVVPACPLNHPFPRERVKTG